MKLYEIAEAIEKRVPKEWAEPWDNPGLLAGERGAEVEKIAVALDASPRTVARAAERGCGLLVTHHPIIFRPVKSVVDDCHAGRTLLSAVKSGVALYAAHTNWDSSPEGVNFVLASELGLKNIEPLVPSQSGAWGLGAAGDLPRPVRLGALGELLRERWNLSALSLHGNLKTCGASRSAAGPAWTSGPRLWRSASSASSRPTFRTIRARRRRRRGFASRPATTARWSVCRFQRSRRSSRSRRGSP